MTPRYNCRSSTSRTVECAHPTGRPCCGRGAGTSSAFKAFVMRVRPEPPAHSSKMRRTTAASASLMRRFDVRPSALGVEYFNVVVPEHPAAGHVPGTRLPGHGVGHPQPRLLTLKFV